MVVGPKFYRESRVVRLFEDLGVWQLTLVVSSPFETKAAVQSQGLNRDFGAGRGI